MHLRLLYHYDSWSMAILFQKRIRDGHQIMTGSYEAIHCHCNWGIPFVMVGSMKSLLPRDKSIMNHDLHRPSWTMNPSVSIEIQRFQHGNYSNHYLMVQYWIPISMLNPNHHIPIFQNVWWFNQFNPNFRNPTCIHFIHLKILRLAARI